jgi:threonyl-tRNA synthetase
MADAVQRLFPGTQVTIGPAIENGFYYDFDRPQGAFSDEELGQIEAKMKEIIAGDLPFTREVVSRDDARKMLEAMGEKYKVEILEAAEEPISIYRHGDWIDLCRGPHVPTTKHLGAVKLTSAAGAYWRGDERNKMLQRIYGTAFANEKDLRIYLQRLEEAKQRDNRKLCKELDLIAFHPWAPASPFFLPKGASIYNRLVEYIRSLYGKHGYQEVITPQIFDRKLYETSGHWDQYEEGMFLAVDSESAEEINSGKKVRDAVRFGVKPMNCPGHCLIFGTTRRSYRELPLRMADFGRLHRFERSGVTQGLTRVRTFAQDDGHIFCTLDQAREEIIRFHGLIGAVYRDFGFADVRVVIATRPSPDKRLGSDEEWEHAEQSLKSAMDACGSKYEIAEGEGAFYGPKIEYHLKDAIGRPWQLGTMQFDFNMPKRFELAYIGEDNTEHRPVMLHRAMLGSVERFFGILIEHVGGSFPTWLAPEQIRLLTVTEKVDEFANEALAVLQAAGIRATADLGSDKLGAKIRNARLQRIPYLGVVGQKEAEARGLAIRSRDENKDLGLLPLDGIVERIRAEGLPPSARNA